MHLRLQLDCFKEPGLPGCPRLRRSFIVPSLISCLLNVDCVVEHRERQCTLACSSRPLLVHYQQICRSSAGCSSMWLDICNSVFFFSNRLHTTRSQHLGRAPHIFGSIRSDNTPCHILRAWPACQGVSSSWFHDSALLRLALPCSRRIVPTHVVLYLFIRFQEDLHLWVRAAFPHRRCDQLMRLWWTVFSRYSLQQNCLCIWL